VDPVSAESEGEELGQINANPNFDLTNVFNDYFLNDPETNPYAELTIDSIFYDNASFTDKFKNSQMPIFLSLNAQSLQSKHEKLCAFILELCNNDILIDAIAIQETWQLPYPDLVQIPGFTLHYKTRVFSRGGGVGFYIRNDLNAKVIENLSTFHEKIFESITIELICGKRKFLLSNIYRSPSPNNVLMEQFLEKFDNLLNSLNSFNCQSLVFLDSNVNLLNLNSNAQTSKYMDSILNNGFLQTIFKSTRIQNQSNTLIDHILSNRNPEGFSSGTVISDISDHFFTFFALQNDKKQKNQKILKSRSFNLTNLNNFKLALSSLSWESTTSKQNVNECMDAFYDEFLTLFNLHFPILTKKFNKNYHKINDFMTIGLLISRKSKIKLQKKSILEPTIENLNKYKSYRNIFNTLMRKSKIAYFENNLNLHEKNPKKTWEILKEVMGKKVNSPISEININGTISNEPAKIAEEFNSFFSSVGSKIAANIRPVEKDPLSYIPMQPGLPELDLGETGEIEVRNFLNKMDKKTSPDLDGISVSLLKFVANEVCIPLGHIFNVSITTGLYPEKLKTSRVVPIYKCGEKTSCDNYRPISLVSSISKILEKIVANRLVEHLVSNDLLYEHQYGFLKGKSTEHNLLHLVNTIGQAINDDKYCIGIFLDLKKAFDVVPHDILLKKLSKLGVNGTALNWFASYLSNRKQKVDINGNISSSKNLDISVLQGTILGPILFLCFINDLPNATTLDSRLFADDTACTHAHSHLPTLIDFANTEIQKLANWFRANKMAVNISKTKYIIFHGKGKKVDLTNLSVVYNDNEIGKLQDPLLITPLERVFNENPKKDSKSYKLLGVYLDETLSFKSHIDQICNKLNRSIFCIGRAKNFLTKPALKSLYFALVHPHLLYCLNIFSCANKSNLKRITILQKKAVRIINKTPRLAHTSTLFVNSEILPFEKLISQSKVTFMHSVEYGYCLPTFSTTWPKNNQRQNHNLRNANDFYVPVPRVESFKNIPLYSFPVEWNSLPEEIKYQNNRTTFKIALKDFLLNAIEQ